MKIAVLGGSFNPIHVGHLVLADCVCSELGYDRVLFVPDFKPPHKELAAAVSAVDRLAMVSAAVAGDERFVVESCEIDRGGISYTYDTIQVLKNKYAGIISEKIGLILGSDLFADYCHWHRAEELAIETDLILARRPLENMVDPAFANRPIGPYDHTVQYDHMTAASFPYPHQELRNGELLISSSDIRRRIGHGEAWRYLVPEAVFRYIISRNLYD